MNKHVRYNASVKGKSRRRDYARRVREERIRTVTAVKIERGCELHSKYYPEQSVERDPDVLQFHHRDPKQKLFTIAHALRHGAGLEKLLKEIEKCLVACANCHVKYHKQNRVPQNIRQEAQ